MNLRNTYILFGAVIVVLAVFVLVLTFGSRGEGDDFLLAELRGKAKGDELGEVKKSIDRVEIERLSPAAEPLLFEREGTHWVLKRPYIAQVDGTAVDHLVAALIDARVEKKGPTPSKGDAGLDPPSAAVTLMKGDKSYRILFGQMSLAGGGRVYAATGDKPDRVLVLRRGAIEDLLRAGSQNLGTVGEAVRSVSDFRSPNLLVEGSMNPWNTTQRIVLMAGSKEVILRKDSAGGWSFDKPQGYGAADLEGSADQPAMQTIAGVRPLLSALAGLRMPPPDDVIEGAANLADYGLTGGKEEMRIEVGRDDGGSETLLIGKKADPAGAKVYATLARERIVMKLDAKAFEPIRQVIDNPSALRDRTLTQITPFSVDAIDVKFAGEPTFELRRFANSPQWRLFEGSDAYENASIIAINELLNKLTERRNIRDFPDTSAGDKALGLDPPAVQIDLWVGGIIQPEKTEEPKPGEPKKEEPIKRPSLRGEPTLRLSIGKKDKDIVYVRRATGIVSMVVALPESVLPMATRPLTAYLDLVLPSFDRNAVTKIGFNRGAVKYEIDKGTSEAAPWAIAQPPDLAGRPADPAKIDQIVASLGTLGATSVVARKATPAELDRFGLKTPKTTATVTLKDVKEAKVYEFGNDSEDKAHLYFRFGGSDRVYLVEKARLDPILSDEIIDPTIWKVDAAKIRGIKLIGWASLGGGKTLTLDLLRKTPSDWSVKDQADYAVDILKAESFATSLALVRSDRFVKSKGGPGPEHKLDLKDDALQIEVTVEGEKEPYVLTVGGELKENNTDYSFASSSKVPGAVFLVFRDRFDPLRKGGRGYFQKAK
jgi:hypothetical protein